MKPLMKNALILSITTTLCITATFAQAADTERELSQKQKNRHAATVTTLAVVGSIAAGPFGFIAGTLGGYFIDKNAQERDFAVEDANQKIIALEEEVETYAIQLDESERKLHERMEVEIYFETASDTLSAADRLKMQNLATYLTENPEYTLRLDGYSDARGTEEYNNVLSLERAKNVAKNLHAFGVDEQRIEVFAHGERFAASSADSEESYTLDRRVDIEILVPSTNSVAQAVQF